MKRQITFYNNKQENNLKHKAKIKINRQVSQY